MAVVAALLVVVVVTAVAILLAGKHSRSSGQQVAQSQVSASQPPKTTASTEVPSPTDSVSSAAVSISVAPTPTGPATRSHINLTRVATVAELPQVAELLDTYFTGINSHNAALATSVFASNGVVNPSDPSQVASFGNGISTSTDDRIEVLFITPASFDGEPGVAVRLRFRSRQAAAYGPNNDTCTNWLLTEELVSAGVGYQLLGSQNVQHTSC